MKTQQKAIYRIGNILMVALLAQPVPGHALSMPAGPAPSDRDINDIIESAMSPRSHDEAMTEVGGFVGRVRSTQPEMLPGVSYTLARASQDYAGSSPAQAFDMAEASADILTPDVIDSDPDQAAETLVVLAAALTTIGMTEAVDKDRISALNNRIDSLATQTAGVMDEGDKAGAGAAGPAMASRMAEAREAAPVAFPTAAGGASPLDWGDALIGLAALAAGGAAALLDVGGRVYTNKVTPSPDPVPPDPVPPTPVPLPPAALLFLSGLLLAGARRR